MDLEAFRRTIPSDQKQQSERMQISGFLSSYWDRVGICDIEYVSDDPPDFIVTLKSGARIGIELKRLDFHEGKKNRDVAKFKGKYERSQAVTQRYTWRWTTCETILNKLDQQLKRTVNGSISPRARTAHGLDQLWLIFAAVGGNPVAMIVEYIALSCQDRRAEPDPAHSHFIYQAAQLSKAVEDFDAILLSSGPYAVGLRNCTGIECLSLDESVLEHGKGSDPGCLKRRYRMNTSVDLSGFLRWSNG